MEFTEGGRATIIHSRGYKLGFLASNVTVVVGGQEGQRQKLSITITKSAKNFKSWPCKNLEPMRSQGADRGVDPSKPWICLRAAVATTLPWMQEVESAACRPWWYQGGLLPLGPLPSRPGREGVGHAGLAVFLRCITSVTMMNFEYFCGQQCNKTENQNRKNEYRNKVLIF